MRRLNRAIATSLAAFAAFIMVGAQSAHAGDVAVRTEAGRVRGSAEESVVSYLGVPYAAAPTGALRWRPPQPPQRWRGVRQVRSFAPACMQAGVSMPGEEPPPISEDCLYLNIWAPLRRARAGAPVMVWIHGGGYTNGSTAMPLYWGDRLAQRGVVFMSIAYRLGPFGYLAHPELSAESGRGCSGNYGLMDQIAALRWVRANIAAFGGDPNNVTIIGQSAGAMSVSQLMASRQAAGLFHRAIGQSGGLFEPVELAPSYTLAQAERDGIAYARSLGAESLAALRRLPAEQLVGDHAAPVSHPVIEPCVLPMSPYDAYVARQQNDVPVLVGANAEEARALVDLSGVTAANFTERLTRAWGPLPSSITSAYRFSNDEEARRARAAFERDLRFGWDMWAWARLQAQRSRQPAFYYRFAQRPPFPADSVRSGWGASHFAELWYVFDHLDQEPWAWSASDRRLADAMSAYWVNFARSGDPNGPGLPHWPQFAAERGQVLILGDPITTAPAPVDPELAAFDAAYEAIRGAPFPSPPSQGTSSP